MYQMLAVAFAALALLFGIVGIGSKLLVTTNPVLVATGLGALAAAAFSFFMRFRIARQRQRQEAGDASSRLAASEAFWKWMSRLSVVVSLVAGLLSIWRNLTVA